MSRCVILSAGPVQDPPALTGYLLPDDYILAADGGLRLADAMGVKPVAVVADFDSATISDAPDGVKAIALPVEKDVTDTAKALEIGYEAGYRDFLLLGCTGGRLDHQQAVWIVAAEYARRGCAVVIVDERNEVHWLTAGTYVFPARPDEHISLFAAGGDVRGLFADGLYYGIEDITLSPCDPLCVSNHCIGDNFALTFKDGLLLLYFSKD